jgi:hypothetical protein
MLVNICGYRFVPATNRIFQTWVIGNIRRLHALETKGVPWLRGFCLSNVPLPFMRRLKTQWRLKVHADNRWNGLTPNIFGAATIKTAIGGYR